MVLKKPLYGNGPSLSDISDLSNDTYNVKKENISLHEKIKLLIKQVSNVERDNVSLRQKNVSLTNKVDYLLGRLDLMVMDLIHNTGDETSSRVDNETESQDDGKPGNEQAHDGDASTTLTTGSQSIPHMHWIGHFQQAA